MTDLLSSRQSDPTADSSHDDRREHYRIEVHPNKTPEQAQIFLTSGETCNIEVVNFSQAGLLFYVDAPFEVAVDDHIPKIAIAFPHKPGLEFAGRVVRVDKGKSRVFCGLRFEYPGQAAKTGKTRHGKRGAEPAKMAKNRRDSWTKAIKSVPNYMREENFKNWEDMQQKAYAAFRAVEAYLAVEERWWFFEMLDELKRKEPSYPPKLLDEFISVCERNAEGNEALPESKASLGAYTKIKQALKELFRGGNV